MFQHMFSTMNDMLDQIIEQYPNADINEKQQYDQQLKELKKASDVCIAYWIDFEERLAEFKEQSVLAADSGKPKAEANHKAEFEIPGEAAAIISKGQGYYNLFMFHQAASEFQLAVAQAPECNLARLFLGMTQMHLQNWNEAQRHFQLLIVLTDFPKWLALGYNALGCIQAVHMNMAQAEQLFRKAYEMYPDFKESLNNLKSCQRKSGQLSLYFGSTELCCL